MTDSGYSATPLAKKLRIKPGHRVALRHAPADWSLPAVPDGVRLDAAPEEADVVLAFYRAAAELRADAKGLVAALRPESCLWLLWPRRAAGHVSDLTDGELRATMLPLGVVDVKVAAVGEDWSGLAFVWRKENRPRT
ncbi:DUF3052 domain-containing protein [Streptacidiphilus pinicola]|uniref:DUF3052 domain-containing protein n=1 Tax=Streptacidiphilus pinicola TaxID=2219663 RepID=A0A2X0JZ76_9ACTN|nr:DUF3052 domain-containing protein [Streptacidiphilus pinicola]RAG80509.1 DUF3052 domain-containing protein [Streptacidiphilus pinicola]